MITLFQKKWTRKKNSEQDGVMENLNVYVNAVEQFVSKRNTITYNIAYRWKKYCIKKITQNKDYYYYYYK